MNQVELKMANMPSSTALVASSFFLLISTFAPNLSNSGSSSDAQIVSSLQSMGYSNVRINGCTLSFSRETVPTEDNNYLTKYDRYVNLRTLDLSDGYEVRDRTTDYGFLYIAEAPLNSRYYEHKHQITGFELWVLRNYPNSNWPHLRANLEVQETAEIEAELWIRLPQVKYLNRWTNHNRLGSFTVLHPIFRMTYDDRSSLVQLMDSLADQSANFHCSNLNIESDT